MSDYDQLRVQIFTNLSLALITAAFTTLAGIAGGFALIAGKFSQTYTYVVSAVVVVACVCLMRSIYFGGRGVHAAHEALKGNRRLQDTYAEGNFNKQAVMGLAGIALGVIVFLLIGYGQPRTTPEVQSLLSDILQLGTKVNSLEEKINRLDDVQQQSSVKTLTYMQDVQTKVNSLEEKVNRLEDIQKQSASKPEEGSK
jgi:hypothetical protein